ncbi:PE-PPE domain-containing protein [Mycobacterium decipiens]|uniref:PE-PPE domain-containing protein n=1 Tax=Mycobacterium decipiens TaxID=1430326 RepID=A0A1X2LWQ0_9MYCO|nr:PE-PPE domain-containing protein [Mycobacterium decipiens]OSC41473.1 PE-PPE domain-containing protein [Mycobacterium decipiens]
MSKLFVAAIAVGTFISTVVWGSGVAAADTDAAGEIGANPNRALIVAGTSRPVPWLAKLLYHWDAASTGLIGANYYDSADATRQFISYPGTVWPITGLNSPTVGQSVGEGANNLDAMIRKNPGPMTVVGLSQGSQVMEEEQVHLANDPNAPPPDQLSFIKVSSPQNLLERLFKPGTHLPFVNYTVLPQVDSQYDTVQVIAQYDIYGDPPARPGNLLADVNSVLGRDHSLVAFSDPSEVPPQNVTVTTNSKGATVTTYLVPAAELPLVAQLRQLGVPAPVADQMEQVMRPMIDRAYQPEPSPGINPRDVVQGIRAIPAIVPAISIPIEGATLGAGAATTAATATATAAVAAAATRALSGPRVGVGAKGPLSLVRGLLPKGKK